jgi:L-ascorbate metabolism protein UlaG (beta-lactamase superfamily)
MLTNLLSAFPISPIQPFHKGLERRPESLQSSISLTYLGTAGFVFSTPNRTVVVDPYVTRPSLNQHAFTFQPNEALVQKWILKVDDVLVGHAHHDHILDAPCVCHQTGARLIGSSDVIRVGRAAGIPEKQLLETNGRENIDCGPGNLVRGIPSAHGKVYFNRVTLPGHIPEDFKWPAKYWHFRHGHVLNWYIELDGLRFMYVDSAEFFAKEWQGITVDVLCLCAIGRNARPSYIEEAIEILQPKVVMACHWDCFWIPMESDQQYTLPMVNLEGFIQDVEKCGAKPMVLPIGETISV